MPERKLVLLVEDNEALARFFRLALEEKAGCEVQHVKDVQAAVESARRLHPDAIHMDVHLDGSNGWDAIRIIKADESLKHIPIIVVSSAWAEASRSAQSDLALVAAIVEKPIGLADYVKRMLSLLGLDEPMESLSSQRARPATGAGDDGPPHGFPQRWRA